MKGVNELINSRIDKRDNKMHDNDGTKGRNCDTTKKFIKKFTFDSDLAEKLAHFYSDCRYKENIVLRFAIILNFSSSKNMNSSTHVILINASF